MVRSDAWDGFHGSEQLLQCLHPDWDHIPRPHSCKAARREFLPGAWVQGFLVQRLRVYLATRGPESHEEAVVLNTQFCTSYSDFTLHWTDKDSMREVRSLTSEYSILSPGVLGNLKEALQHCGCSLTSVVGGLSSPAAPLRISQRSKKSGNNLCG